MKKKWLKKGSAVLLAATMVLSLFTGMNGTLVTVQAAENVEPESGYWTDAEGLKTFGISEEKTIGKIRFGASDRLWAICGADGEDNLALLSTSMFEQDAYGTTREYSESNFVNKLTTDGDGYLSTTYFSRGETEKMAEVTVSTNEPDGSGGNHSVQVANKKLYLPNSYNQNSYMEPTIYVGSNNDIAIDVKMLDDTDIGFTHNDFFWLRSPDPYLTNEALAAEVGVCVHRGTIFDGGIFVVPAFNLNLSDVSFASAAEAASSTGYKENCDMTENTYTLRYTSGGIEKAVISASGKKVTVTGASGKYLMVQNNAGVYALAIDSGNKTVNASELTEMALDNFNNCKVWIESTDSDRITTAKMATQDTAPTPPAPTPTYTITAGAGGTHELGTDETLTITCDGALDKLTGIYVDDKLVDAANYALKSGSTILTFKAAYLNTLSVGTHKLKFQYSDGSAETSFNVKNNSTENKPTENKPTENKPTENTTTTESPKTGDTSPILLWGFVIMASGIGAITVASKRRKKVAR